MPAPATPPGQVSGWDAVPNATPKQRPATTQNTPARLSGGNLQKRASVDASKQKNGTNTLQTRILQWQESNDDLSPESGDQGQDVDSSMAQKHRSRRGLKDPVPTEDAAVVVPLVLTEALANTKPDNHDSGAEDVNEELRAASTPKKRIVSDEHWKNNRSYPSNALKFEVPSKAQIPGRSTPPSGKKADAWVRRKSQGGKFGLNEVRTGLVSTQELRQDSTNQVSNEDSRRRRDKSKGRDIEKEPVKPDDGSSLELNVTGSDRAPVLDTPSGSPSLGPTSPPPPNPGRVRSKLERPSPEVSRRSTPAQPNVLRKNPPSPAPPKGHESRSFSEEPPATQPKIFGSRIEAWLGSTPDPFTEKPSRLAKYSVTPPSIRAADSDISPVERTERRKSRAKYASDQVGVRQGRSGSPSDERYAESHGGDWRHAAKSPTSPPPALKRSGAHRRQENQNKEESRRSPSPSKSDIPSLTEGSFIDDADSAFALRHCIKDQTESPNGLPTMRSLSPVSEAIPLTNALQLVDASLPAHNDGRLKNKPKRPPLNRATTSHADLMSVLSLPVKRNKSIRSACSIRTDRLPPEGATVEDLMKELREDEAKYSRELQTLVDGVVPVLLSCVLSRSDSVKAAGLFNSSKNTPDATGSIVNMGIALERLKSVHKRIPTSSPAALLMWAQGAHRVYVDYLKAWRLGFKDVVVNLAPADETNGAPTTQPTTSGWDEGLKRNSEGYVVSEKGEKVDVAFLLKRPLVRLKYLSKTFKGIHALQGTEKAETWASRYQELVGEARKRQIEERARLEDEAAAIIDPTRARDPSSLAPLQGVEIDPSCSVRGRDYFDLQLDHSSGQRVDCRIELILRDGKDECEIGDLLVCEVDDTSRWLFFPPIEATLVSAREGESKRDIVVMIRGDGVDAQEWRELLCLRANDDDIGREWIEMLGSSPLPPPLPMKMPFSTDQSGKPAPLTLANLTMSGSISPQDLDVPMGEMASVLSQRWEAKPSKSRKGGLTGTETVLSSSTIDQSGLGGRFRHGSMLQDLRKGPAQPISESQLRGLNDYDVQLPSKRNIPDNEKYSHLELGRKTSDRPGMHWRTSSLPSKDVPTTPNAQNSHGHDHFSASERKADNTPLSSKGPLKSQSAKKDIRPLPQTPISPNLRDSTTPDFSPSSAGPLKARRSSSPLKHEYQLSDSAGSSAAGDILSEDEGSISSESSIDDDTLGPLPPPHALKLAGAARSPGPGPAPRGAATLGPSDSASQAPYRTVPTSQEESAQIKQIASIFCWSDKGLWESLHPDECSIVVSPGLIEAFEMTAAHSRDQNSSPVRPLVALELTPLVPLRKGTAIDISIRSPPTANSKIRTGNNIMFRSRNNQECEVLYGLINQARINNPTYIALQNARGPGESNWAAAMDRRASSRGAPNSWWRFGSKKSSYRAGKSRRTPSVAMESESSVATMSTAFSALKRFSANSKLFNVARSTITSQRGPSGSRGASSTSMNSLSDASGESAPVRIDPTQGTPAGITNVKIRLYERESASKWRDMGPARLTIMHPPRAPGGIVTATKLEKRIVATGKTKGETLLDATLSETAFERVARTGIAVSIWSYAGEVGKTGGVGTTKVRVFMIQMGSEAEAAFAFSLVGKLRY